MKIKCPICQNELIRYSKFYKCKNNHTYDISKEGYINLLRKQSGKNFGDSTEMINARHLFLSKNYYKKLQDYLLELIIKYKPKNILDLGCGEGYYTNYINKNYDCQLLGIDISKKGIKTASKNSDALYILSSIQDIPVFDKSIDLAINLFAPLDINEIKRVLTYNGILITIVVGKKHLLELKKEIYDNIYLNDNMPFTDNELILLDNMNLNFIIQISNNEDIKNLFLMTPYSHHTSIKSKNKINNIQNLNITCDFDIYVYKNISSK